MNTLERELILQLKDCFFELFDGEFAILHSDDFIKKTLYIILKLFRVETAAVYTYIEWDQHYYLAEKVSVKKDQAESHAAIPSESLKALKGSKGILRGPFSMVELESYDLLIDLQRDRKIVGFMAFKDCPGSMLNKITDEGFKKIGQEYELFLGKWQNLKRIISEEKKYKELYRVTEKFHSSMDIDNLLGEIIITLQGIYPAFSYDLLLSQDYQNHSQLPIRDLEYDNENMAAMEAYVTGTVQFEDSLPWESALYAPLKGKQGVYGVLVVYAPNTSAFPRNEVEFITLLANTAGSAMENTQLYQQSRRLIADLQLINETSHCLNSNLRLLETIHYMSEQIIKSFKAQEVGFFLYSPAGDIEKILQGSTAFFSTKQAGKYIEYVREKIQKDNEALFIGDLNLPHNDEEYHYRSIMAVPMTLSEHLNGIVIVIHQDSYYFSFETFKLLQSLIHHSTLAFTNSMLREELEKMIITDHLTKLHSRTYLDEKINLSMHEDVQGAFILLDIDEFKKVNDTYGHQVGDEVLIQLANIIQNNIRENDTGARWGGEELAIYLPKVSLKAAVSIATRLVEKVAEDSNPHVTVSCGVSYWHKNQADSYNNLFKRADKALYSAKRAGKNRVVIQKEQKSMVKHP